MRYVLRMYRSPSNVWAGLIENPGLKVNRGHNFSCIKVLPIACVLCSLRLLVLKTEGQKPETELLTEKLQK